MTDPLLLPTDDAFNALDKSAQKQTLVGLLDNFLDHAAAANRTPDDWERAAFRYAVTCLRHGLISAAMPELKRLVTPALQRPDGRVPRDKYPQTILALRSELQDLLDSP